MGLVRFIVCSTSKNLNRIACKQDCLQIFACPQIHEESLAGFPVTSEANLQQSFDSMHFHWRCYVLLLKAGVTGFDASLCSSSDCRQTLRGKKTNSKCAGNWQKENRENSSSGISADAGQIIVCWFRLETAGKSIHLNFCQVRCNEECFFCFPNVHQVPLKTGKNH